MLSILSSKRFRLVMLVAVFVLVVQTVFAHSEVYAWRAEGDGSVTFFAGTYHTTFVPPPVGGMIVDGNTYNFTSVVDTLPADYTCMTDYYDGYNESTIEWQVVNVPDSVFPNSANHTLNTTIGTIEISNTPGLAGSYFIDVPPPPNVPQCAPDMTVTKTNDVGGTLAFPGSFTWSSTISNEGDQPAVFTGTTQTIFLDNLPSGPTYSAVTVTSVSDIFGPISCGLIAGPALECTGTNTRIDPGGSFTVNVTVTPAGAGSLVNPASGICRTDPDFVKTESDESNNDCTDTVNVTVVGPDTPDLAIAKSNNASNENIGTIAGASWDWMLTVSNTGTANAVFTDGDVIFADQLPTTNISYAMASIGSVTDVTNPLNISCNIDGGGLLTCSASGATVTIGDTTGTFTFTLPVTATAAGTYTNPTGGNCGVDPGTVITESDEGNNTCGPNAVIVSAPDLEATKTNGSGGTTDLNDGSSGAWTWTITLANTSAGVAEFASDEAVFTDNLPNTNISYGAVTVGAGTNTTGTLACSISSNDLTCTASGGTFSFDGIGSIPLSFTATPTAATTYANPRVTNGCEIDPDGNVTEDDDTNNDVCTDSVIVTNLQPDLTIAKSNNASNESIGTIASPSWDWSLVVANSGAADAVFTDGQTILSDQLDTSANLTYGTPTASSITNGSGSISCSISSGDLLTCDASGSVTIGSGTGTFTVTIPTTATAAGTYTNTGSTCQVDPDPLITESNEGNNTCTTNNVTVTAPDLEATKTNDASGGTTDLDDGNSGAWTWTITLANTSAGVAEFASGETVFTDNLPNTNISYGAVTVGAGTNTSGTLACSISSNDLTCTASGGTFSFGGTTGSIPISFVATPTATTTYANPRVTNGCEIDPDGNVTEDDDTNNDVCTDSVVVTAQADLAIAKSNNASSENIGAIGGASWDWMLTVSNTGTGDAVFTDGQTILSDQLDTSANLTYGTPTASSITNGSGSISCSISSGDLLTCDASGSVTIGSGTGTFTVTIPTTATAAGTYTNTGSTCQVDPDSLITESNEANNTCTTNNVTVSAPDLEATKTNGSGGTTDLDDGSSGAWTWTITLANTSAGVAEFASGETVFTDNLPNTNISYGAVTVGAGTNTTGTLACSISSNDLTCTASGGTFSFGGTTGSIPISFVATPTAATTYANPRVTNGCEIDPDGNVTEDDDTNNDVCTDSVIVTGPQLTAVKDDIAASGLASVNIPFTWVITVANSGGGDAVFNDGETIVIDTLPNTDVTYGAINITNVTGVNDGDITCSIDGSFDLTCTVNTGTTVTIGNTTGTFDVEITTTLTTAGAFDNPRSGGSCAVDPDTNVSESVESDNVCADTVTGQEADLLATKVNDVSDTIILGSSWTWITSISNTGVGDAIFQSGDTIFTDDLPNTDISYGAVSVSNESGITGTGSISCSVTTETITCTASGGTVIIADTTGGFDVNITATPSTSGIFDNPRSGGFCEVDIDNDAVESNNANNSCSNSVTVVTSDLTVAKTNDAGGRVAPNGTFNWTLTINNGGGDDADFILNDVVLNDDMPVDGSYGSPTIGYSGGVVGTISCTTPSPNMSCTADGALTIPAGETITVTIPVTAPSFITTLDNPESGSCEVDSGNNVNEGDETNNACADSVGVGTAPNVVESAVTDEEITFTDISIFDPAISKIGVLQDGQVGLVGEEIEWVITVTNNGNAIGNNIIIVDNMIPALQIDGVSGNVNSITTINGQTVTVTIPTLDPGQSVTYSIFTTVLESNIMVDNIVCLSSNSGNEVCTTAQVNTGLAVVTQLPSTGETPNWRNPLLLALVSGLLMLTGSGAFLYRKHENS